MALQFHPSMEKTMSEDKKENVKINENQVLLVLNNLNSVEVVVDFTNLVESGKYEVTFDDNKGHSEEVIKQEVKRIVEDAIQEISDDIDEYSKTNKRVH